MKSLITLLLVIAITGCKTCETEKRIADGFTKYVAKALSCTNIGNLRADIADMCSSQNFCSGKRYYPDESIPSGSWSEASLACLHVTGNIANLAVIRHKRWGCKEYVLETYDLERVCEKL